MVCRIECFQYQELAPKLYSVGFLNTRVKILETVLMLGKWIANETDFQWGNVTSLSFIGWV